MGTTVCLLGSTFSAALPVQRTPKIVLITVASVGAIHLNYWLLPGRSASYGSIADIIAIAITFTHAALSTRDKSQSFSSSLNNFLC